LKILIVSNKKNRENVWYFAKKKSRILKSVLLVNGKFEKNPYARCTTKQMDNFCEAINQLFYFEGSMLLEDVLLCP